MASCNKLGVWTEVHRSDLPSHANVLPIKWVYKMKLTMDGTLDKRKARVTPKGFKEREGIDYTDVFAPTGKYKSMRIGLSLSAKWNYELDQLDVPTAFLNAPVHEDIYVEMPDGYKKEGYVYKLNRALYGLKQAPREWYLMISAFISEQLGFSPTVSDPCLFHRRSRTGRLMLLFLFVDDFQVSYHSADKREWDTYKRKLVERFNTKDMGASEFILGMRIRRDRKQCTITLDQELYICKALEKYGLSECKPVHTPETDSGPSDMDAAVQQSDEKQIDIRGYQEIVGTLLYAAISTRPDIAHAVLQLTKHMQSPYVHHMTAAMRVLRYLSGTKERGLVFGRSQQHIGNGNGNGSVRVNDSEMMTVAAYADANWGGNVGSDRKSIMGWIVTLNGDVVSWASKKQRTVAQSTCEAELYAEAAAINEVLWQRGLLGEMGLTVDDASVVYGDNQSTITLSRNGVKSERTKHVDIKYHFVTERVNDGTIMLQWIPTTEQRADILTKPLGRVLFSKMRGEIMM